MKKQFLALALLFSMFSAHANCNLEYTNHINEVQTKLNEAVANESSTYLVGNLMVTSGFVGGAVTGFEIAASTGFAGTALAPSSTGAGVAIVGVIAMGYLAEYIFDFKGPELRDELSRSKYAFSLLREGKAGDGHVIQSIMNRVWNEVDNTISPKDVADAIENLNTQGAFCLDGKLDNAPSIVNKAINLLKEQK